MTVMSNSFKRWLVVSGVSITRKARVEGAAKPDGNPTVTYTDSTVKCQLYRPTETLIQMEGGVLPEESRIVDIAVDQAMAELDEITVDGITYVVGPVETRRTYRRFRAKRVVG
jgi:hypothetical protein